jgi:hypothetical protein
LDFGVDDTNVLPAMVCGCFGRCRIATNRRFIFKRVSNTKVQWR